MAERPTATRLAQLLLGQLWEAGVRDVVLSPGSLIRPVTGRDRVGCPSTMTRSIWSRSAVERSSR
jgi:hypothetical protein